MSVTRRQLDEEFKKNAVKLSYASSKTVAGVARELERLIVCVKYSPDTALG